MRRRSASAGGPDLQSFPHPDRDENIARARGSRRDRHRPGQDADAAIVCLRELEIRSFQPEDYFEIVAPRLSQAAASRCVMPLRQNAINLNPGSWSLTRG